MSMNSTNQHQQQPQPFELIQLSPSSSSTITTTTSTTTTKSITTSTLTTTTISKIISDSMKSSKSSKMVKEMWSTEFNDDDDYCENTSKQQQQQQIIESNNTDGRIESNSNASSKTTSQTSPVFKTPKMLAPRYRQMSKQLLMAPKMSTSSQRSRRFVINQIIPFDLNDSIDINNNNVLMDDNPATAKISNCGEQSSRKLFDRSSSNNGGSEPIHCRSRRSLMHSQSSSLMSNLSPAIIRKDRKHRICRNLFGAIPQSSSSSQQSSSAAIIRDC